MAWQLRYLLLTVAIFDRPSWISGPLQNLLKELCRGDFQGFFGENCLKLELSTFVVHKILIEHKEEDIE